MSRWFSSQQPQRIKIRLLTICCLLLGAWAFAAGSAAGTTVPDWVTAAARQPIPSSVPKDAVAVILYSDQETTVNADGGVQTRYREVRKILRPKGKDYGFIEIFFTKVTPITSLRAWGIPSEGKIYELKESDAAETGLTDGELYDDAKRKIIQIPAADPGNIVAYEYIQKGHPLIFADDWDFQYRVPVLHAQYTLQIPDGWKYNSNWVNHTEVQPQSPAPNQYTWDLSNIAPVVVEDDMPPWRAVAGRLDVKFFSPENSYQAEQSGTWHDEGLWYSGLSASRRDVTPEISAEVASLTVQAKTPLEKIQAITSYMQRQIRYVAIEIGIGGFQPHFAADVFKNQFGDCKDKATLLSAMLKAAGFESYYAVAQVYRGIVQPQFASVASFNHMILAIRLPVGLPTENLYSIVHDPKLGNLLFFDPTDPYTPLGYLPDTEQDNYVLLVTPDGGQLVHLPVLPPATNRLLRVGHFTITPAGGLAGDVQEIRWGGPAVDLRAQFLETTPKDREKILESFLGGFLDNFQLQAASIGNLTQFAQALTVDYRFSAPSYARQAGNLLILHPRVLGEKGSSILSGADRKYPVEYPEATLQTDTFDFVLPVSYTVDELPPPVAVNCGYISYSSKTILDGNTVHYTRTYQINSVTVPVSELANLRTVLNAIATDERSSIVLKASN